MRTTTFLALTLGASFVSADTLSFSASQDNTMFFESVSLSNGAGNYIFAGTTGFGAPRRALVQFDVSAIPASSTIQSVTLTLGMSMTNAGPQNVELHRLTASWGEGTSAASGQEGAGAPAAPGDATWQYRFFNTTSWSNLGGDFDPTVSAVQAVAGAGFYTWGSTAQLVLDVQSWVNTPSSNAGWIVIGDESTSTTAKRFDSRTNINGGPPVLVVTFTPPPLGTSFCTPGQAGVVICPCSNPPSGADRGCNNSSASGGAALGATGVASLALDSARFSTTGELASSLSIVLQGNANLAAGTVFGEGVRCVGGALKRLRVENAVSGGIVYPDGAEPLVSVQSAALGDPIAPGSMRWYMVYYRDPSLPCAGEPNFNATQGVAILWNP